MSGRHGGKRPGAGRPKGALNGDGADIRAMVIGALDKVGGLDYLAARAIDSPAAFLTLVGKVLPLQLQGDPDHPVQFVIRGPSPVESANDWLKLHAPTGQIVEAESE
jgi:hypothetical protein